MVRATGGWLCGRGPCGDPALPGPQQGAYPRGRGEQAREPGELLGPASDALRVRPALRQVRQEVPGDVPGVGNEQ